MTHKQGSPIDASAASLSVESVTQSYGTVTALDQISLSIDHGEFLTLLGPSGCGKTTLLRVIAGFITPTAGRVLLGGRDITGLPPHRRPVNMVFQRPTLFPHLDVFENIAFGLRIAKLGKKEISERVLGALALVRLEGFESRRAYEVSGGQMQRIALARALVNEPKVLLLDEPLSALDLKIRLEMEVELRRVHRETGATFVYVTHDQREALALSDRIAVFDHGRIEQLGSPLDVYRSPRSPFAARFVGNANVIPVDLTRTWDGHAELALADTRVTVPNPVALPAGPAWLVLRPESVRVMRADGATNEDLHGIVRDQAFRGTGFSYRIEVAGVDEPLKAEVPASTGAPAQIGETVRLDWDPEGCVLLHRDTP